MKLTTIQLFILFSIAWFVISCEKLSTKKAVSANVQVIDLTTGVGMPNRTVILKELKSTLPGVDVTVIDEATTDANGNCTFEFEAKKATKFKYEVEFIYGGNEMYSPPQWNGFKYKQIDRLIIDKLFNETSILEIVPSGKIKLFYFNFPPANDLDTFYIFMNSSILEIPFVFSGISPRDPGDGLEIPYGAYTLKITGTSNGMPYEEEREIYLEHNQTLEYNLEL